MRVRKFASGLFLIGGVQASYPTGVGMHNTARPAYLVGILLEHQRNALRRAK